MKKSIKLWRTSEIRQIDAALDSREPVWQVIAWLARAMGRTERSVESAMQNRRRLRQTPRTWRRWTEQEIAELRRLRAEGMPWAQVAAALGRTRVTVKGKAISLGMTREDSQ